MPDNVSAAALSLTVNAAGAATAKVTVLLTPEEIDTAAKKTPNYRPPGSSREQPPATNLAGSARSSAMKGGVYIPALSSLRHCRALSQ